MPTDRLLCFSIYATGHAFNRLYHDLLSPAGLTYPQYLVMVVLWNRGPLTVGQLGAAVDLESSTLTPLLKRLETGGLISRTRSRQDERQVMVAPTEAGQALRAKVADVPACVGQATGMDEAEIARLMADLARLRKNLQSGPGGKAG